MKTIKAILKQPIVHLFLVTSVLLSSGLLMYCSNVEPILTSGDVLERIDIVLEENNNKEYINLENEQSNTSADIVSFNFYGPSSTKMDFKLQLDDRRTLIFSLVNKSESNFWELENTKYSIHPNQDLSSIYKYVTAEITSNGETSYTSNLGSVFPNEIQFDVFKITTYDPLKHEMVIHIENLQIAQASSLNLKKLTINGTFRGSITFAN